MKPEVVKKESSPMPEKRKMASKLTGKNASDVYYALGDLCDFAELSKNKR